MAKSIIYPRIGGGVCILAPANCGLTIEQIAAKGVPAATPYNIIDDFLIPKDRDAREIWEYDFSAPDGWGDKGIPLSAKFWNQIYSPAIKFFRTLAEHPYAVEPESNILLHQFEGLVLHINHFAEKNGLKLEFRKNFRDLANSIKHTLRKPEDQVNIESAVIFEENEENKFRFIRNTILARYPDAKEFDAIEESHNAVVSYFPLVGIFTREFCISESRYPFYSWAVTYHRDDLAASTQSFKIITVKKTSENYVRHTPKEKRFVCLDISVLGQDPRPHFPRE